MSASLGAKGAGKSVDDRNKAVDLVTGKVTQEYFFDPSLLLTESSSSSSTLKTPMKNAAQSRDAKDALFFQSKYLFVPCTIIKPIVDEGNPLQAQQPALPVAAPIPASPQSATSPSQSATNPGKKKKKKKGKGVQNSVVSIETECADQSAPASAAVFNPNLPYAGPTLVKTSDGALHKISDSTRLIPIHSADNEGVSDILRLPAISEAALLYTLRLRYRRDEVYTAAGQILISINPYKQVMQAGASIYSEQQMMLYRRRGWTEKPPHLFQVADRAYTALVESVHSTAVGTTHDDTEDESHTDQQHEIRQFPPGRVLNQSIIISGESGAGKTEATKIIMTYLAKITRKNGGNMIEALADRVLSSNPLLETFGNAQTLRNNNSSRFGKFIHIFFNCLTGAITGASISNYLLEKTRITAQVEGERNYHIFYQLLSGATDEMLKAFGLEGGLQHFQYLGNTGETSQADNEAFSETMACLTSIGLSSEDQWSVFGMAAAVLHLGNIQFEEGDSDTAKVSEGSRASLHKACELLGLDVAKMSEAVLTKVIVVNGKQIHKPQNVALAEDKRDALAKMTYACLFLWLVNCVNERLRETSGTVETKSFIEKRGFIGVLDIYGFECFDTNGFEQLLINYCNETLQRHFNRHLFEVEQELYANEGVDWSYITFNDNRPCLELIEGSGGGGGVGILNALDDAWSGMGTTAKKDEKFAKQLHEKFGGETAGHPNFVTSKFGNDREFTVVHYAGGVKYTVDGFVEKNMETMSNELRELGEKSTNPIAKKVYIYSSNSDGASTSSSRSSIRGVSVGSQFRTSLQSLVYDLERTQPHYIRCIKPNLTKSANAFMAGEVLKQLRYSGMMEAIRIRQDGYALREEHESFFERFSVLLSPDDLEGDDSGIVKLVTALSRRLGVSDADWQVGHSKIFLRRYLSDKLERMAKLRIHCAARTLTKFGVKIARRRAANFIVAFLRFRMRTREKRRLHRAANKISGLARGYFQRQQYAATIFSIVRIQTLQRRLFAVHRVRKIHDPFYDLSFRECTKLLHAEKERLDIAIKDKNFNRAKKLEEKMTNINSAIESKRPVTRAAVDRKIASLRAMLEDAVKRLAFDECGPLQDQLDELAAKQNELPTIFELQAAVAAAEQAMSLAAKNRDFAGAAAAQTKIAEAQKFLLDTLAADNTDGSDNCCQASDKDDSTMPFVTRAQLEASISQISVQIDDAIKRKNAIEVQDLKKKRTGYHDLRKQFPTADELRLEIRDTKQAVDHAVAIKEFSRAGSLNDTLAELENRLQQAILVEPEPPNVTVSETPSIVDENGETIIFSFRIDLEEEIASTLDSVSRFATTREFKLAAVAQARVDEMLKLRELLPTTTELQQKIESNTTAMQLAIASKQFAKAEEMNQAIEHLERKLKYQIKSDPLPVTQRSSELPVLQTKSVDVTFPNRVADVIPNAPPSVNTNIVTSMGSNVNPKGFPTGISILKPSSLDNSIVSKQSVSKEPATGGSGSSIFKEASGQSFRTDRPVSKLRPAIPLIGKTSDSVLYITQRLTVSRSNACIIVDEGGVLAGILTDTDITRRVVAKFLDPVQTPVSSVMTPSPTCVASTDVAMVALTTMVENHFRHLPVTDQTGSVVGLLDIAKCLNDAITKLEKNHEKSSRSAEIVVKQVLSQQTSSSAETASLQALLGSLMSHAFGGQTMPTLRSLLTGKPSTILGPDASVRDAGLLMSDNRKASLVVNKHGELIGVFTFKDMMMRAVAKELQIDSTKVSEVMTPNPDFITPDKTVLEALQIMHDQRFLTLPVCEVNGSVVGLVDVMDVIYGCGGVDGWKSIFNSAMGLHDDSSEILSVEGSSSFAPKSQFSATISSPRLVSLDDTMSIRPNCTKIDKSVAKLRPSRPCLSKTDDSILSVVRLLKSKRASASLIVNPDGGLAGIVTDTDITRRVVAKYVEPQTTNVSFIMTANPTVIATSAPATDALTTMVENHFRHMPVVDDEGTVVGILDIAKCLNDAISKLEKSEEVKSQGASHLTAENAVKQAIIDQGGNVSQASALLALLGNILSQNMGDKSVQTVRNILTGKPSSIVSPNSSVRDAGIRMAESRKAALVVDDTDGQLLGILSMKDMCFRAVAEELSLEDTPVSQVMTKNPETVSPDITVLEALQIMHDHRFLTLPVCESDGTVVGVVDVMDVIYGCGGADGWRSIFSSAMNLDEGSVATSSKSKHFSGAVTSRGSQIVKSGIPANIPSTLEFMDGDGDNSFTGSTIGDERGVSKLLSPEEASGSLGFYSVIFKVTTPSGSTHRIRCEPSVESLFKAIESKTSISRSRMRIEYEDDEGDVVVVSSDDDVAEAYNLARKSGKTIAKLSVFESEIKSKAISTALIAGGLTTVALLGAFALLLLRPKKH